MRNARTTVLLAALITIACGPAPAPVETTCTTGAMRPCGSEIGACELGLEACVAGEWSGTCEGGQGPVVETCNLVDDDCDGMIDGPAAAASCEPVPFAAEYACSNTTCVVRECEPQHGDCDGLAADGCETSTADDRRHCGRCGHPCDLGRTCQAGACLDLPQTGSAWSAGGSSSDWATDIALAPDGSVWLVGNYRTDARVGGIDLPATSASGFAAHVDADGVASWTAAATALDGARVAVTSGGAAYLAGTFSGTLSLGTLSVTADPVGSTQIFVARVETFGVVSWIRTTRGTGLVEVVDVATSSDGSVVVLGTIEGNKELEGMTVTSGAMRDVALLSIDAGGVAQWLTIGGGDGLEPPRALAIDESDRILVAGDLWNPATFGSFVVTPPQAPSGMLLVLSPEGTFERVDVPSGGISYFGEIAVSDGLAYVAVTCSGTFEMGAERVECTEAERSQIVALAADGSVRWVSGLGDAVVRDVAAFGSEATLLLGTSADASFIELDAEGATRGSWSFVIDGSIGASSFRGASLAVAGVFTASPTSIEGRVLSSAGGQDVFVWTGLVR